MTWVEQVMATIAVVAAGIAGLAYMARGLWRFIRSVQSIHELIQTELTQNSGGSMKDEVAAIAVQVGQLQGNLRELAQNKDEAHVILQRQLDSIMEDLGTPDLTVPQHRRESEHHGHNT